MQQWLNRNWVAAALCMAILLVLLMPIHAQRRPIAWLFIFAMLPIYMFHHVEERTNDRFQSICQSTRFSRDRSGATA